MKQELREEVKKSLRLFVEAINKDEAQFALGYRRGQSNYADKNLQQDFTGYSDAYKKGYQTGIRDARFGKVNGVVTKILVGLGDILGRWNIGNRTNMRK